VARGCSRSAGRKRRRHRRFGVLFHMDEGYPKKSDRHPFILRAMLRFRVTFGKRSLSLLGSPPGGCRYIPLPSVMMWYERRKLGESIRTEARFQRTAITGLYLIRIARMK